MRGVADEPALGLAGALERGQHGVERRGEVAHLVAGRRQGEAARRIAGALDVPGSGGEIRERAKRAAREQGGDARRDQDGREAAEEDEGPRRVEGVLDVRGGAGDDHRPARRLAVADLAERRGVEPQRLVAQAAVAEPGAPAVQRRGGRAGQGEHAAAEPTRAGDDPPATVDDLHEQGAAADAALEGARIGEHRRGGGGQARDVHRAPAQGVVERAVEPAVEPREHGDAEERHGHRDRHGGRRGDTGAERDGPHPPPSRNPSPRTVSMSGGSPSLRRR